MAARVTEPSVRLAGCRRVAGLEDSGLMAKPGPLRVGQLAAPRHCPASPGLIDSEPTESVTGPGHRARPEGHGASRQLEKKNGESSWASSRPGLGWLRRSTPALIAPPASESAGFRSSRSCPHWHRSRSIGVDRHGHGGFSRRIRTTPPAGGLGGANQRPSESDWPTIRVRRT